MSKIPLSRLKLNLRLSDLKRNVSSRAAVLISENNSTRRQIVFLLCAFTIGKLVVLLSAFFAQGSSGFMYNLCTRWDSSLFQSIAVNGYSESCYYAFSPFYPVLIKGLNLLTSHAWISGFIITNVVGYLFPLVMHRTFGYRTALLTALFPVYLVFSTIPYSDVIPLSFLALSLLFIMKDKISESSGAVTMAVISSFRVAWLLPAYAQAIYKTRRWKNWLFFFIPAVIGVAIFLWFKRETGNYLTYFSVEKGTWSAGFTTPVGQAKWILNGWYTNQHDKFFGVPILPVYWLLRNIAFEVFYLIGAFYLIKTPHQYKTFLFLYTLIAIIPLLCVTGMPAISIPRLLLPAFPVFYSYSVMFKRQKYYWIYLAASLALTIVVTLSQMKSFFA
jgi:hypothetical protein